MSTDAAPGRGRRTLPLPLVPPWVSVGLAILTAIGCGCSPDAFLVSDEDRDRNFQRARDAERLGDYPAAAEHYERALDKNPRMAAVHLGYATLSEFQLRRYADAVYHYQRYLRLRPDDPQADDIRRRITNCTERLATTVPLVIRSETIARDLESVRGENQSLRAQVTNLVATASYWSNEWRRMAAVTPQLPPGVAAAPGSFGVGSDPPAGPAAGGRPGVPSAPGSGVGAGSAGGRGGAGPTGSAGVPVAPRTVRYHRVAAGETMESVARRYGISGAAIRRANPQIEPRRMRPGVELRIPAR